MCATFLKPILENAPYVLTELFVVLLRDIFPHNSDIGISVTSALFVPEAKCMSDFMNNCAGVFTSIANAYILFSAFPPHRRPAPETEYECCMKLTEFQITSIKHGNIS